MNSAPLVRASQAAGPVPPYPAALSISGPAWQSPLAHEGQVPLIHPEIHIGLLAANDIVLSDPGASRLHAVIRWTPNGYEIQDLGSTNGTFVEGQRIAAPTVIMPGQHIRIGSTDLLFQAVQVHQDGAAPAALGRASATTVGGTVGLAPSAVAPLSLQAITTVAERAQQRTRFSRWLAAQRNKHYWRFFLGGFVAYIIVTTLNTIEPVKFTPTFIPLILILASALVPVTFVIFCWDEGAFADMPASTLGLAFIGGGVFSMVLVTLLYQPFGNLGATPSTIGVIEAIMIGVIEETGKAAAVLWFLRDKRLRSELDGLVLGAAVGMGFSAIETAAYGLKFFLKGAVNAALGAAQAGLNYQAILQAADTHGLDAMLVVLNVRMGLAIFGHGVWTAIIAAAIWRERGRPLPQMAPSVALAWAISVCLHAAWDLAATHNPLLVLIPGAVGIFILRFFIEEAVARAKLGVGALPPPPLVQALAHYSAHPFQRFPRPVAHPSIFASAQQPTFAGDLPNGTNENAPIAGRQP